MMEDVMLDLVTSSGLVRQWTLINGEARCELDAIEATDANAAAAYGRSLAIQDLLERDAAYPPAPPIPAEGEEPDPDWTPPEIDADVAALRLVRRGPQIEEGEEQDAEYEAARVTIDALLANAEPVTPPMVVPAEISDRQFAQGLERMGLISKDEARAFIKTGDIPPALDAFVQAIPDEQARFDAEITIAGATVFRRQHALVLAVAAGLGWPDEQIDAFWAMCGAFP
jgi:hypothetical protein